jgi:hypothetical protein
MEALQNLLTLAIEVVAVAGFGGIAVHAIWSGHCKWMKEYCPVVKPFEPAVEPDVEPVVESVVEEVVVEFAVEPVVEEAEVEQPAPLLSKYEAMGVKRLRQECQIHCIDWKKGGDYGKPMRKNQMIRALSA